MGSTHIPSLQKKARYRAGALELDSARGVVMVGDHEKMLRYQSFQVLHYLMAHPGRVVTKHELSEYVWQNASVTDNALVQCIAEIRRALGEDAREPTYVKTVPKVGYRFTVECRRLAPRDMEGADGPTGEIALAPEVALATIEQPETDTKVEESVQPLVSIKAIEASGFRGRMALRASVLLLAGLIMVLTATYVKVGARLKGMLGMTESGQPLLLDAFEDRTSSSASGWMKAGVPAMLNADLAMLADKKSKAAHTAGIRLTGSVADAGDGVLRVEAEARDREGRVRDDEVELALPGQLPLQINALATRLAARFAQPPPTPDLRAGPEVTTVSPEAYRYYSLGVQKAQRFETTEAIALLEKAVHFDPQFAMAYARLGYSYAVVNFLPERALPYLELAAKYQDGLPETYRLLIEAWTRVARRDYRGAEQTLRVENSRHPEVVEAWRELACLLRSEENLPAALAVVEDGLRHNPTSPELYNTLGFIDMSWFRYPEAIAASNHAIRLDPDDPNLKDSLGMVYQRSGQYDAAVAVYTVALTQDPEFEPALVHLADTYYQQGRYREAIAEYQHYIDVVHSDEAEAMGYGDLVRVYQAMGRTQDAAKALEKERKANPRAVLDTLLMEGGAEAVSVRPDVLNSALDNIIPTQERGTPGDLRTEVYYRGLIAMKRGNQGRAIAQFKDAVQHLPPSSGMDPHEDCLGLAYLHYGMGAEAVAEFKRVLKDAPGYPLAEYHLGQALEMVGDKGKAREAYRAFLAGWTHADADVPAVVVAQQKARG